MSDARHLAEVAATLLVGALSGTEFGFPNTAETHRAVEIAELLIAEAERRTAERDAARTKAYAERKP